MSDPAAGDDRSPLWAWHALPAPQYVGGNRVRLLRGGDELFPAMREAIATAREQVWVASYIFHDDPAACGVIDSLCDAARRGVQVHVVADGFGSKAALAWLRERFAVPGIEFCVFRPIDRWHAWTQPGQLRRLHQKLCATDDVAFVGGINLLDDRIDLTHGPSDQPRLDFAVELRGPVVARVRRMAQAMAVRARLGHDWRNEVRALAKGGEPVSHTMRLLRRMRVVPRALPTEEPPLEPVRVAFVVRDNLRQRRDIERSYIEAMRRARVRIDLATPYFYPGRAFRRTLRNAAARGVKVRLLLQGKPDYRIAALAARVLYNDLLAHGIRIFEYTPAFLHAKVAVVDGDWATVGSSNIDPLSLLLNLEANVVVRDAEFADELSAQLEQAFAASLEVVAPPLRTGWRRWLSHGFVAWCAGVYLRLAGISVRY